MHLQETLIADLTESEYNQLPGLRSTELKAAARSALHWKHYKDTPHEQTDALRFGAALHAAVLQPALYATNRRIAPIGNRTTDQKQVRAAFDASLTRESFVVSPAEHEAITSMVDNVRNHAVIAPLLERSLTEQTFIWHDKEYDVACKLRADVITAEGIVLDVKTAVSADMGDFTRQAVHPKTFYCLSAAHYLAGLVQAKISARQFGYIVIEKSPPYAIALYEAPDDMLDLGERARGHAILNIKEAQKTGKYRGYSEDFLMMETPGWAKGILDVGK